jgi:hypothetical protein
MSPVDTEKTACGGDYFWQRRGVSERLTGTTIRPKAKAGQFMGAPTAADIGVVATSVVTGNVERITGTVGP